MQEEETDEEGKDGIWKRRKKVTRGRKGWRRSRRKGREKVGD